MRHARAADAIMFIAHRSPDGHPVSSPRALAPRDAREHQHQHRGWTNTRLWLRLVGRQQVEVYLQPSNDMADVVNTVGVSDKTSEWRHDIRCPSIIRICSDRNVGPFWTDNITSNFIQDHAPQFFFGLEYLWSTLRQISTADWVSMPRRGGDRHGSVVVGLIKLLRDGNLRRGDMPD